MHVLWRTGQFLCVISHRTKNFLVSLIDFIPKNLLMWYLLPDGKFVSGIAKKIVQQGIHCHLQTGHSPQFAMTNQFSQSCSAVRRRVLNQESLIRPEQQTIKSLRCSHVTLPDDEFCLSNLPVRIWLAGWEEDRREPYRSEGERLRGRRPQRTNPNWIQTNLETTAGNQTSGQIESCTHLNLSITHFTDDPLMIA